MAEITFPSSPTDEQIFTSGGRRWRWSSSKNAWEAVTILELGAVGGGTDPLIRTAAEGAPEDDTFATLSLGTGEAGTLYTSVAKGATGELVTITHASASALATTPTVAVVGTAITVTPAAKGRMLLTGGPPGAIGEILVLVSTNKWGNAGNVNYVTTAGVVIQGGPGAWQFILNVAGTPTHTYTSASSAVTPDLILTASWSSPEITSSALASTAAQNQAAVNASGAAAALVTAAPLDGYTGTSTAATASATALANALGTTPTEAGQLCIVGDVEGPYDVYVCTQLDPAMWLQLDTVALTQAAILAGLTDMAAFRTSLGLGSVATLDTGTDPGEIPLIGANGLIPYPLLHSSYLEILVNAYTPYGGYVESQMNRMFRGLFISATEPTVSVRSSTGYARLIRWDGSLGVVAGGGPGTEASLITPSFGTAIATPYTAVIPKYFAVMPCTSGGVPSGYLTTVSVTLCAAANVNGLTGLTSLTVSGTFPSIDVSTCTSLQTLVLSSLRLIAVNYGPATALRTLTINGWGLAELDLSALPLTTLTVSGGNSTALSFPTSLTWLQVSSSITLVSLSLTGLTSLTQLTISSNSALTSIDLSGATALTSVSVASNAALLALTVSGLTSLATLSVTDNTLLATLTLTGLTGLQALTLTTTAITSLNLTGAANLLTLAVTSCSSLSTVTGLTGNTTISLVSMVASSMTSLSLAGCSSLTSCTVLTCSSITSLTLTGCSALTAANISQNAVLTGLSFADSPLLLSLTCELNPLMTSVDLSGATAMTTMNINDNVGLLALDVSDSPLIDFLNGTGCTSLGSFTGPASSSALIYMVLDDSALTSIDLSGYTNFYEIYLTGCNSLTSITFSSAITGTGYVYVDGTAWDDALFETLVSNLPATDIAGGAPTLDLSTEPDSELVSTIPASNWSIYTYSPV